MSNVERRVVEMRFDNQDFEKNVGQTLISLETLQKALQMQNGEKGLNNIAAAAKTVDMSKLEQGVQSVADRFSTLGIIGMRVLQNLTDAAMRMVGKLGSTFLGPLFSGGKQRAMNMSQAKFMFSGLGKTAKEIGSVGEEGTIMDNLYKSVEGTFYSLDKAALIGSQLMAAGVDYKTELTDVMRSIAGVASVYNMDYQRVGQLFTQIKAGNKLSHHEVESFMTAGLNVYAALSEYLNKINDTTKYTQENVKEMISKGEIDFETFTNAMKKFSDQAQKSKQLVTGAFEDMGAALGRIGEKIWKPLLDLEREFFNSTVPLFDNVATRLSPFFETFGSTIDKWSNRITMLTDLTGAFFDLGNTITELTALSAINDKDQGIILVSDERLERLQKFRDVLTQITLQKWSLPDNAKGIKMFNDALAQGKIPLENYIEALSAYGLSTKEISSLKDIAGGAKVVLDMLKNGFNGLINTIKNNTGTFRAILDTALSFFAMIGRGITSLSEFAGKTGILKAIFNFLNTGFNQLLTNLREIFDMFGGGFNTVSDSITGFFESLAQGINDSAKKISTPIDFLKNVFGILKSFVGAIFNSEVASSIKSIFSALINGLSKLDLGSLLRGIASIFAGIGASKMFTRIGEMAQKINAFTGSLDKVGLAGVAKAFAGNVFSNWNSSMYKLQQTLTIYQNTIKAGALLKIAEAVAILAGACLILSTIDGDKLANSVIAVGSLFGMLAFYMNKMSAFSNMQIGRNGISKKSTGWILALAAGIFVIAGAVKKLSNVEDIHKGLIAIGVILGMLTGFMYAINEIGLFDAGSIKTACASLLIVSVAIRLLVKPIKQMAELSDEGLEKGLIGLAGMLVEIYGFIAAVSNVNTTDILKVSGAIIMLSIALNLLMLPVKLFSKMDMKEFNKGLGGLAIMLVEIFGFMAAMSMYTKDNSNFLKTAGSMILFALAVNMLMVPIKVFSKMDGEALEKGLVGFAVVLGGMAMFFSVINELDPKGMIAASGALAIAGIAVNIIASALKKMGKIDNLVGGLVGLAGSLTILTIALHAMSGAKDGIPAMIACAAALMIMAPALKILSTIKLGGAIVGLITLAGAIGIFAVAAMLTLPAVPVMLALGGAFALLGIGALSFAAALQLLATTFATGAATIILGLKGLFELIPEVLEMLAQSLTVIATKYFVPAGIQIILALLEGVQSNIYQITMLVADIIVQFMNALSENMDSIIDSGFNLIASFFDGIANGIEKHGPRLVKSIGNILLSILEVLVRGVPLFGDKAAESIHEYRMGLESGEDDVETTAKNIANTADNNLEIPDQYQNGRNAVQGLVSGLQSMLSSVRTVSATIGRAVDEAIRSKKALDEHSPSKRLFQVGAYATQGLINGLESLRGDVEKSAIGIGAIASDEMSNSFSSLSLVPSINTDFDTSRLQALSGTIEVQSKWGQELEKQATLMKQMQAMSDRLSNAIENQETNHSFNFTIPFDVNGREFARATAAYNQQELDRSQMLENRKLGIV